MALPSCTHCGGFLPSLVAACPNCETVPPARRTWRHAMMVGVLGAMSSVTLMACYGAPYEPGCYDDPYNDCYSDSDCATGSVCTDEEYGYGWCEWTGGCSYDSECPEEQFCDAERATCTDGPRGACDSPYDCDLGEACLPDGTCQPAVTCDATAPTCGVGARCDFTFNLCTPCEGEACGTCAPAEGGTGVAPTCPIDTTAAIDPLGAYTGACIPTASCLADLCAPLDEATCLATAACEAEYAGLDCVGEDGGACVAGQPCTCASYEFAECVGDQPAPPAP